MNKAVIMAGGFGTRLRPLTMKLPKPMVSVLNKPMMEHIIDLLKKHGIKNVLSLLYFYPDVISRYFEDGQKFDIKMEYVKAEADYGTAGAVRNAKELLHERFIVISGDVLTDFDLSRAVEYHKSKNAMATILLTRVWNPLQYGIVMTDENGKIKRFLEKPSWGEVFTDTINTGIYILEPEILEFIPYQKEYDFSKDLFPLMLEKELPLYGYIAEGYWKDVGNLKEYRKGQKDAAKGKIKLNYNGINEENLVFGLNSSWGNRCIFKGKNYIGDNTRIGEYSELSDTIIGNNVKIGTGAKLTGVIIWDETDIGDYAEITDSVICNNCIIGKRVTISENVFIAESCIIGQSATLTSNIKLWPKKRVEEGAILSISLVQEEKWLRELFTDARITGLSNLEIHPDFGAKLGAAIGMTYKDKNTIIASRDTDRVSRIMKRSISAGLASVGINIHDVQVTSIPQTRQELRANKYAGGFHVRRSPRNPDQTDIIILSKEGRDINLSKTKAIERYFFGEDIRRVHQDDVGKIYFPERTNEIYRNRYLESLNIEILKSRNYKILLDYSYGLASMIFPNILGKINVEALTLHNHLDTLKLHTLSLEKNTAEAERIMKSLGYELGFIIDPGAEKITVLDENGFLYNTRRLLTIVTKLFLDTNKEKEPYKIAVSVLASQEIEEIAKGHDVKVQRIKDTHYAMMEATRDEEVLFVGGVWGNFIFSNFLFAADGMYSIGKILEMLAEKSLNITELNKSLPVKYQSSKLVSCPWEFKGKVMRKAMGFSEKYQRELVDGVKIFEEGNSVLLLPDKEKGAFLIQTESNNANVAEELLTEYIEIFKELRDSN
jgi:mannose-1-phosphate guanylyltransferase / phosphomannomutase